MGDSLVAELVVVVSDEAVAPGVTVSVFCWQAARIPPVMIMQMYFVMAWFLDEKYLAVNPNFAAAHFATLPYTQERLEFR